MFRHVRDPTYTEDLPLAARWLSRRETTMETTYHYRGMLDDLRPSQLVPGPPLVPLRGSRGNNSHSYSVVYVYTDGQWENWRDHVMTVEKRVSIQFGVPWESHLDYLPWFPKVSHLRVSPRPVEVPYTESAKERNAAALAILDSALGGTRDTNSTCPYELQQALVEVRRTLRGPEVAEASRAGPSSEAAEASRYTRCRRRDRT
ncbi:hypothetical protein RHMOL_Rhmol09G0082500 [Rhododendron molle]|uniref:Uncharacterized protein n=1 Tax=Rhododendron molle TaxID=49168 RepID=A0ACC0MD09_RHOML|nr:hypothetical protein RHMOL_Rhmol09G0082500 [Rhododendron molle]